PANTFPRLLREQCRNSPAIGRTSGLRCADKGGSLARLSSQISQLRVVGLESQLSYADAINFSDASSSNFIVPPVGGSKAPWHSAKGHDLWCLFPRGGAI